MQIKRKKKIRIPFSLTYKRLVYLCACFPCLALAYLCYLVHRTAHSDAATDAASTDRSVLRQPKHTIAAPHVVQDLLIDSSQRDDALSYVRSFNSFERPLKFLHIPKTASTAIAYAAGTKKIAWGSCLFNHKPKCDICIYPPGMEWPHHVGWRHLPLHLFPLASVDPYKDSETFAVVRDNYDRMVSEFYYICTLKALEWRPDQYQRDRLFEMEYMNSWLREKLQNRDKDSALGYLSDNGHFTPQYEFNVGPGNVRMVDYVLKLEDDLFSHFTQLMEAFSFEGVELKKMNALGAEDSDADTHLGVDDLEVSTLELIRKAYAHDFEFGYQRRHVS